MTTKPVDSPNGRLCRGCGAVLHPAATKGWNGEPNVYDRHPGCETSGRPLHLIKGARK